MKSDRARQTERRPGRILVIDDEPIIAELLRDVFVRHGYDVEVCFGGPAGIERASEGGFDLVVSDFAMPGASGLDLAQRLAKDHPQTKVVIVSAFLDGDVEELLHRQLNVCAILRKPFDIFEVVRLADRMTDDARRGGTPRAAAGARDAR